jgi:putative endonuclease
MHTIYGYWVYILASQPHGTLYIGVTNDILGRTEAHRAGKGAKFTAKYKVHLLVHYEQYDDIEIAKQRERSLKRYRRDWKFSLIERENPHWKDFYPGLLARHGGGIVSLTR